MKKQSNQAPPFGAVKPSPPPAPPGRPTSPPRTGRAPQELTLTEMSNADLRKAIYVTAASIKEVKGVTQAEIRLTDHIRRLLDEQCLRAGQEPYPF